MMSRRKRRKWPQVLWGRRVNVVCNQNGLRRSTQLGCYGSANRLWLATAVTAIVLFTNATTARADETSTIASSSSSVEGSTPLIAKVGGVSESEELPHRDAFSLSLGGSAWSGDFGSKSTTDISAGLLSAQYDYGEWRLSATLPYTRITTAGDIFLGIGATPLVVRSDVASRRRVNEGIGDLTLGVSYLTHTAPQIGVDIELLGGLKVPTASTSSHVSTGQVDFSVGTELSKPIGKLVPFVSVIYRDFGSSPFLALRDGIATSVGASYVFSPQLVANVSYDYARGASHFIQDSHEIVSSVSYKFFRSGLRLSSYASAGLSSGAPGISGGISLTKRF